MTLPRTDSDRADEPLTEQKTKELFKKFTKKKTKKPIETVDLEVPATMIQIGDKAIGERLGKEPNVLLRLSILHNNREIFIILNHFSNLMRIV